MSDLISRQAAIDAFEKELCAKYNIREFAIGFAGAESILKGLPSAQPEQKRGKWIGRRSIAAPNRYECSVCKRMTIVDECMGEPIYCYCPWCGAKTKGAE